MKERPILFSAPMVRALLAGTKTQTRRLLKLPHGLWETSASGELVPIPANCRYGKPGDRLWVRETWGKLYDDDSGQDPVFYRADYDDHELATQILPRWKPSIHMARSACRLMLEVTGIRIERLQAITDADIHSEGAITEEWLDWREDAGNVGLPPDSRIENERDVFQNLWESINGPDSWAANPWVWVVEFKKVTP